MLNAAYTVALGAGLVALAVGAGPGSVTRPALPQVEANDNRVPAGTRRGDTLALRLAVQRADWYPEDDRGPFITVEAFGEEGKAPQVPAPLVRVPVGTTVRAGTFMYHTHINDIEQVMQGAIGPLIVLEPGERYEATRDHVYIGHWNGDGSLMVNGDSTGGPPLELAAGITHRFRFINIGPADNIRYRILQDTTHMRWRARAKDGADLPPARRTMQTANQRVAVGETFDFDFTSPGPGVYEVVAAFGLQEPTWRQRLTFR